MYRNTQQVERIWEEVIVISPEEVIILVHHDIYRRRYSRHKKICQYEHYHYIE